MKERIINDYAIPMLKNGIWSIFSSALSLISRIQWRRQSGGQEARRLIFLSRYGRTMH